MGEVIDFENYRRTHDGAGSGRPRRRKTPGGRGFNEDPTRQLSTAQPGPPSDDEDDAPEPA